MEVIEMPSEPVIPPTNQDDLHGNNIAAPSIRRVIRFISGYIRICLRNFVSINWARVKLVFTLVGALVFSLVVLVGGVPISVTLLFALSTVSLCYTCVGTLAYLRGTVPRAPGGRLRANPRLNITLDNLRLLLTDRDFNAEDYDALLALDENLPTRIFEAATESEIRRLPTHTLPLEVAKGKSIGLVERECSVCLEQFQGGEVVKTLPCLHRFHSDCVDTWLNIKGNCPTCKFTVRGD